VFSCWKNRAEKTMCIAVYAITVINLERRCEGRLMGSMLPFAVVL